LNGEGVIGVSMTVTFGMDHPLVLTDCPGGNEQWFERGLEVVPVAGAGRWPHHERSRLVTQHILAPRHRCVRKATDRTGACADRVENHGHEQLRYLFGNLTDYVINGRSINRGLTPL
jgi:hypothetical protein